MKNLPSCPSPPERTQLLLKQRHLLASFCHGASSSASALPHRPRCPTIENHIPLYLGLTYLAWALLAYAGLACTFAVALIHRLLISHRLERDAFMTPAGLRRTLATSATSTALPPPQGPSEYLMLKLVVLHAT
jgi:hypothetical protein